MSESNTETNEVLNTEGAEENTAASTAGDEAGAVNGTEAQPPQGPVPTPEQIEAMVKANAQISTCGLTLGMLVMNAQHMIGTMTANNPRLALAIANELTVLYTEAIRRSIRVNDISEKEDASDEQVG